MLKKLMAAPVCYVILSSVVIGCSGQNLKSQQGQGEEMGSQPAQQQPADNANQTVDNENPYTQQATTPKEIAGSFLTQCGMYGDYGYDVGCNLYQVNSSGSMSLYAGSYQSKLEAGRVVVDGVPVANGKYQRKYPLQSQADLNVIKSNSARMWVSGVGPSAISSMIVFEDNGYDGCENGQAVKSNLDVEFERRLSDSKTFVHVPPSKKFVGSTIKLTFFNPACYKSPVFKIIVPEANAQLLKIEGSSVNASACTAQTDPNLGNLPEAPHKCYLYSTDFFNMNSQLKLEFSTGTVGYFLSVMSVDYTKQFAAKISSGGAGQGIVEMMAGLIVRNVYTDIKNFEAK